MKEKLNEKSLTPKQALICSVVAGILGFALPMFPPAGPIAEKVCEGVVKNATPAQDSPAPADGQ